MSFFKFSSTVFMMRLEIKWQIQINIFEKVIFSALPCYANKNIFGLNIELTVSKLWAEIEPVKTNFKMNSGPTLIISNQFNKNKWDRFDTSFTVNQ